MKQKKNIGVKVGGARRLYVKKDPGSTTSACILHFTSAFGEFLAILLYDCRAR